MQKEEEEFNGAINKMLEKNLEEGKKKKVPLKGEAYEAMYLKYKDNFLIKKAKEAIERIQDKKKNNTPTIEVVKKQIGDDVEEYMAKCGMLPEGTLRNIEVKEAGKAKVDPKVELDGFHPYTWTITSIKAKDSQQSRVKDIRMWEKLLEHVIKGGIVTVNKKNENKELTEFIEKNKERKPEWIGLSLDTHLEEGAEIWNFIDSIIDMHNEKNPKKDE